MTRQLVQFEGGVKLLRLNKDSGISLLFGDIAPGGSGGFDDEASPGSIYFQTNGRLYQKRLDNTGWTKFAQELSDVVDIQEEIILSAQNVNEQRVLLTHLPVSAAAVRVLPNGGIEQFNGLHYNIVGQYLVWREMPLSLIANIGTKLWVSYTYTRSTEPPAFVEVRDEFVVTAEHLLLKKFLLSQTPAFPSTVRLVPVGGIEQLNGVQYRVNGQHILWDSMGLDGNITLGQRFYVFYNA